MWVIKFGGSIMRNRLSTIIKTLDCIFRANKISKVIVVPGGGVFADSVRKFQNDTGVSDAVAHEIATMSLNLTAKAIVTIDERFKEVDTVKFKKEYVPVLLPYDIVFKSELPRTWQVTSDSIACYVAKTIGAKLVLLKSVDGLYLNGKFVKKISRKDAEKFAGDVFDRYMLKILGETECWIVNGLKPERVVKLVKYGSCIGSLIKDETSGLD